MPLNLCKLSLLFSGWPQILFIYLFQIRSLNQGHFQSRLFVVVNTTGMNPSVELVESVITDGCYNPLADLLLGGNVVTEPLCCTDVKKLRSVLFVLSCLWTEQGLLQNTSSTQDRGR